MTEREEMDLMLRYLRALVRARREQHRRATLIGIEALDKIAGWLSDFYEAEYREDVA